jgi:hypothetical protein
MDVVLAPETPKAIQLIQLRTWVEQVIASLVRGVEAMAYVSYPSRLLQYFASSRTEKAR